jgi:hypothetical protein
MTDAKMTDGRFRVNGIRHLAYAFPRSRTWPMLKMAHGRFRVSRIWHLAARIWHLCIWHLAFICNGLLQPRLTFDRFLFLTAGERPVSRPAVVQPMPSLPFENRAIDSNKCSRVRGPRKKAGPGHAGREARVPGVVPGLAFGEQSERSR